jgi:hypothetical protein
LETESSTEIKIFSWYLWKGVILTKDNLAKRKWRGSLKGCFYNADETIEHLFFGCHVARNIWNLIFITFGIQPPTSLFSYTWLLAKRVLEVAGKPMYSWGNCTMLGYLVE